MTVYYLTKDELYHYGIKGQKKGSRRYQFGDGTWTEEGKARRRLEYSEHTLKTGKSIAKTGLAAYAGGTAGAVLSAAAFMNSMSNVAYAATLASATVATGGQWLLGAGLGTMLVGAIGKAKAKKEMRKEQLVKEAKPKHVELEKAGWIRNKQYDENYYTKRHGATELIIDSYGAGDNPKSAERIKSDMQTAKRVEDNFAEFNRSAKNAALKDLSGAWLTDKTAQNLFTKNAKLQSVSIYDRGTAVFDYYGDNDSNDGLSGHVVTVEYDTKNKRPLGVSVNG